MTIQTLILLLIIASLQISGANVQRHSNVAAVSSLSETSSHQPIKEGAGNQVANDVIAIKEGADLDLSCPIAVQNEDMIISWTCDNEPANIRSSRIHVTDSGKLRIHSAKVGDSCNYRCEAADGFGTLSVIIKVIIVDRRLMDQLTRRAGINGGSNSTVAQESSDAQPQQRSLASEHSRAQQQSNLREQTGSAQLKGQSHNGLDIEMHIEPSEVNVGKNRTFSLECHIKHAPNLVPPQIIWLKEYIGARIDSIDEALEKNLLVLDGIYYHSLNWPRATSYSHKSSTASSALLVKQSNYVHSGRYACFAGYPASIMNLHFNNSNSNLNSARDEPSPLRPPMRYKIAQALVKVHDAEGAANYKSSMNYLSKAEAVESHHKPANIFVNVVSSNTWMRNLTVILLIFCVSLTVFKFIGTKSKRNEPVKSDQNNPNVNTIGDSLDSQQHPVVTVTSGTDYIPEFFPDRLNASHVPANSLMNDSNPLGERYEIDQALLNERLNCIHSTNNYSNNDHVYTEIGYQITNNNTEEPYYKQPSRMNKRVK